MQLALLPGATGATQGTARAVAFGANSDGSVIVGEARDSSTGRNAALWRFDRATGNSTVISLGDLPGAPISNPSGLPSASARAVSADGRVVVGNGQSALGNEAFIWLDGQGMFPLRSYLIDQIGLSNLDGWVLTAVTGISNDGRTIVGYGSIGGATQGFVAVIPEPTTLGALLAGAMLLSRRRRHHR